MQSTDTLWNVCERLYFPQSLTIHSEITRKNYRYACEFLATFLGREATIADLTKPVLIGYLKWLVNVRQLAPKTANERCGRIRAMWAWLDEEGLIDRRAPRNIRLPEPDKIPVAWSREELAALYAATNEMPGQVAGVDAGAWWQGLLLWLWNTGARYGETMAVEWTMINLQTRTVHVPARYRKGRRKPAIYRLWEDTQAALIAIRTAEPRVFAWDRSEASYYLHWNDLLRLANLPTGRNRKTQSMRVSHASWLAVRGGDATRSLLHSDPATTRAHYLDSRLTTTEPDLFRLG